MGARVAASQLCKVATILNIEIWHLTSPHPSRPSCTATDDSSTLSRKIAYYEIWAADRKCDKFPPESIQAGALTHINIAFAVIDSGFRITDTNGDIVARVSSLKRSNPGLRVNIAIGRLITSKDRILLTPDQVAGLSMTLRHKGYSPLWPQLVRIAKRLSTPLLNSCKSTASMELI